MLSAHLDYRSVPRSLPVDQEYEFFVSLLLVIGDSFPDCQSS